MEDTIKLPLDADGVPIRPGDVVYVSESTMPRIVAAVEYDGTPGFPWAVFLIEDEAKGGNYWLPGSLSHTRPDTLEDIEQALHKLEQDASCGCVTEAEVNVDIADLMERIKRMVER